MRILFSSGIGFISKPRCGSTSIRTMLDMRMDKTQGDFAVNTPDEISGFHPHMTLPYLKTQLKSKYDGLQDLNLRYFTVTRHPLTMLWSYYKFFRPDSLSRYNYQSSWDSSQLMDFEEWIETGRVGMNPNWLKLAPSFVTQKDLSPLSLEAHIHDSDNRNSSECTILRLEELDAHMKIFSCILGLSNSLPPAHVNQSNQSSLPSVSQQGLNRIRQLFPLESLMYNL